MWVAPTEPPWLKALANHVSLFPEKYGVDVLIKTPTGLVGIQRKTITDFIASVADGRMAKELGQMAQLRIAVVLIEGIPKWTTGGDLMNVSGFGQSWTKRQWQGAMWSIQDMGIWVDQVSSTQEFVTWVETFKLWVEKGVHRSLLARPKAKGQWGKPTSREFGLHVLQSFPGVGAETAGVIFDAFGLPLRWTVDEDDLVTLPGIGKVKAEQIVRSLYRG